MTAQGHGRLCSFDRSRRDVPEIATLAKDIGVRVLNFSASGCLLETTAPVDVGTVAVLRIEFDGRDLHDTVQVVRCQEIEGSGELYYVGLQFVSTSPPDAETLRYAMQRKVS